MLPCSQQDDGDSCGYFGCALVEALLPGQDLTQVKQFPFALLLNRLPPDFGLYWNVPPEIDALKDADGFAWLRFTFVYGFITTLVNEQSVSFSKSKMNPSNFELIEEKTNEEKESGVALCFLERPKMISEKTFDNAALSTSEKKDIDAALENDKLVDTSSPMRCASNDSSVHSSLHFRVILGYDRFVHLARGNFVYVKEAIMEACDRCNSKLKQTKGEEKKEGYDVRDQNGRELRLEDPLSLSISEIYVSSFFSHKNDWDKRVQFEARGIFNAFLDLPSILDRNFFKHLGIFTKIFQKYLNRP